MDQEIMSFHLYSSR